jgi:Fe-S cluster assembly protein SufD
MKKLDFQNEFEKIIDRNYSSKKIQPLRKKAFDKFSEIGLPNKNLEDWRFTNLNHFLKSSYTLSGLEHSDPSELDLSQFSIPNTDTLVFVNGHYKKEFSDTIDGLKLLSGQEYLELKNWSLQYPSECPFELLNTSFMDSGMSIILEESQIIKKPIRFLFIVSAKEELMISPKIHIDCSPNSSFTFIEHQVGHSDNFFMNTSINCYLDRGSSLDHIKIQSNSQKAVNINKVHVKQSRDSQYTFFYLALDSQLSRLDIKNDLNGKGSECSLNGLSLSSENEQLGSHIITNHYSPYCSSSQNFKNILYGNSSGIFNGKTVVHQDAQKTDSKQSNKNLILSNNALMNSNPQLEIYADDVKCSHGSTTGALDEDAIFYLRSRGISLMNAQKLLMKGFAVELFDVIKNESIKTFIIQEFENWLAEKT